MVGCILAAHHKIWSGLEVRWHTAYSQKGSGRLAQGLWLNLPQPLMNLNDLHYVLVG